jgi:nitrogen fixation-related uncharacterized protein
VLVFDGGVVVSIFLAWACTSGGYREDTASTKKHILFDT